MAVSAYNTFHGFLTPEPTQLCFKAVEYFVTSMDLKDEKFTSCSPPPPPPPPKKEKCLRNTIAPETAIF